MNKLDQYLVDEAQSQFSDSKRQIIESTRTGESHMSPRVEALYHQGQEKVRSVFDCEYCKQPYLERDSKKAPHLCPGCEPGRDTISRYLQNNKKAHLTQEDIDSIKGSKTLRRGPFYYGRKPK